MHAVDIIEHILIQTLLYALTTPMFSPYCCTTLLQVHVDAGTLYAELGPLCYVLSGTHVFSRCGYTGALARMAKIKIILS